MINTVTYKVNKETRMFIRFLRENHISYAFINDSLKTLDDCGLLERNMFYKHNGNYLLVFNEMFKNELICPISHSILWSSTTRGFFFWDKIFFVFDGFVNIEGSGTNQSPCGLIIMFF